MKVYLDNAATTKIDEDVFDSMSNILKNEYGNPSSIYSIGRRSRSFVERARKSVSSHLNCSPGEIFFTSGGTEADNFAIRKGIIDLGISHVVSSVIEHHAVGHTLSEMADNGLIKLTNLNVDDKGEINLDELTNVLENNERSYVSLMHANNEIGNLLDIKKVGEICKTHNAIFHSDTVQTMAHYRYDLSDMNIHFLTGAAHKFHGPKGNGFLYINSEINVSPLITGGSQERNLRAGTENVYGIVGLSKALDIAYKHLDEHRKHIESIKEYMIIKLTERIPGVEFNGLSNIMEKSLYTILNVKFPKCDIGDMLLYNLDILGIACSGGSACSSGSNNISHVLKCINKSNDRPSIRFSFSKYNTKEEIDYVVSQLETLFKS